MRNQRRAFTKLMLSLESLDERVLPSAAAVAHVVHHPAAIHATAVHHQTHAVQTAHNPIHHSVSVKSAAAPVVVASHSASVFMPPSSSSSSPGSNASVSTQSAATTNTATTTTPTGVPGPGYISGPSPVFSAATPTPNQTPANVGDVQNGPMANAGQDLITLYQQYEQYRQSGSTEAFKSSLSGLIEIDGTSVAIDVNGSGDYNGLVAALTSLGKQIRTSNPTYDVVEGVIPIAQLLNVSQLPQTKSVAPVSKPIQRGSGSMMVS